GETRVEHAVERHDAASEKKIRRRTMRNFCPSARQRAALALGQMNAMSEHRARPEQAAHFINVRVILRPIALLFHALELLEVFRKMSLNVATMPVCELRRRANQLARAAQREARTHRVT